MRRIAGASIKLIVDKLWGAVISWVYGNPGAAATMAVTAFGATFLRYRSAIEVLKKWGWADWIAVFLMVLFAGGSALLFIRSFWIRLRANGGPIKTDAPMVETKASGGFFKTALSIVALVMVMFLLSQHPRVTEPFPPVAIPPAPIPVPTDTPKNARGGNKEKKKLARPQAAIPELTTPTPLTQPVEPMTGGQVDSHLDTLIKINQNMSRGDRERFSNALFEFSQVLEKANEFWGKVNTEGAQLRQAWISGSIIRELEQHKNTLRGIDTSAALSRNL